MIRDFFRGHPQDNFLEYYERALKENISGFEPNTIKGYKSNLNVLKEFKNEISFSDIDITFIRRFDHYLRCERGTDIKRGIGVSGRFGHHKNLKAILNKAVSEKRIKDNPYVEDNFVIIKPSSRETFLDENEVALIEKLKIPKKNKGLIRTKQFFLFCCYTGLRYSDAISLEWENLKVISGRDFIVLKQKKTKKGVSVPLSKDALAILDCRQGIYIRKVFDPISNQKLNYNLKTICSLAGIKKVVTTHIARHSFASIAVMRGKDLYKLSKVMGHSSITVTQKYAKLDDESLCDVVD